MDTGTPHEPGLLGGVPDMETDRTAAGGSGSQTWATKASPVPEEREAPSWSLRISNKPALKHHDSITMRGFPKQVQEALKPFDADGDGYVDSNELIRAAQMYQDTKKKVTIFKKFLMGFIALSVLLVLTISGMTFAVVEFTKETSADADGTLHVKGSSEVVKVASVDTVPLPGGNLGFRGSNATVKVATGTSPIKLDSAMPDEFYDELKFLKLTSPSASTMAININGYVRIQRKTSLRGSVVMLVTPIGLVTIDGPELEFDQEVGNLFSEAGFKLAPSGRRVLGLYELIGFFNSITDWPGLPADAVKPSFPSQFFVQYSYMYSCYHRQDSLDKCAGYPEKYAEGGNKKTMKFDPDGTDEVEFATSTGQMWFDNGAARDEQMFLAVNMGVWQKVKVYGAGESGYLQWQAFDPYEYLTYNETTGFVDEYAPIPKGANAFCEDSPTEVIPGAAMTANDDGTYNLGSNVTTAYKGQTTLEDGTTVRIFTASTFVGWTMTVYDHMIQDDAGNDVYVPRRATVDDGNVYMVWDLSSWVVGPTAVAQAKSEGALDFSLPSGCLDNSTVSERERIRGGSPFYTDVSFLDVPQELIDFLHTGDHGWNDTDARLATYRDQVRMGTYQDPFFLDDTGELPNAAADDDSNGRRRLHEGQEVLVPHSRPVSFHHLIPTTQEGRQWTESVAAYHHAHPEGSALLGQALWEADRAYQHHVTQGSFEDGPLIIATDDKVSDHPLEADLVQQAYEEGLLPQDLSAEHEEALLSNATVRRSLRRMMSVCNYGTCGACVLRPIIPEVWTQGLDKACYIIIEIAGETGINVFGSPLKISGELHGDWNVQQLTATIQGCVCLGIGYWRFDVGLGCLCIGGGIRRNPYSNCHEGVVWIDAYIGPTFGGCPWACMKVQVIISNQIATAPFEPCHRNWVNNCWRSRWCQWRSYWRHRGQWRWCSRRHCPCWGGCCFTTSWPCYHTWRERVWYHWCSIDTCNKPAPGRGSYTLQIKLYVELCLWGCWNPINAVLYQFFKSF